MGEIQKQVNEYERPGHTWDYQGRLIVVGALYNDLSIQDSQVCQVRFAGPNLIKVVYEDGAVKETEIRKDIITLVNNLILLRDGAAQSKIKQYRSRAKWIGAQLKSPDHKRVLEAIARAGL